MDTKNRAHEDFATQPLPQIRAEQVEVTNDLIIANLRVGRSRVMKWPPEVVQLFGPGIVNPNIIWPTTVMVTRIFLIVEPAPGQDPPQKVTSRVSILGTGWQTGVPVLLKWNNAWGFVGVSIPLPSATVDSRGFFAMDVIHQTVHRQHAEFYWELSNQLVLVAQQRDQNGLIVRSADERGIPPHVIWQWVP